MQEVGKRIEDLVTVDIGGRGSIDELHEAACEVQEVESQIYHTATRLREEISQDDEVFIATGFPIPPTMSQEPDGLLGAPSLARVIKQGLGAHPTILVPEEKVEIQKRACNAYGMNVSKGERAREAPWTCSVKSFPKEFDAAEDKADELLDEYDPSALVAIELATANDEGVYNSMFAVDITDYVSKFEPLFEKAECLTIGIGDGGNEFGMGMIQETVRENVPFAGEADADITAASETDILLTVTISNWGCHGINALLSHMLDEKYLHEPDVEERALTHCGMHGVVDGATSRTDGWGDGLPPNAHRSIVDLLNTIIDDNRPDYSDPDSVKPDK